MVFDSPTGIKLLDQLGKSCILAENMMTKLSETFGSRDEYISNKDTFETSVDNLSAIVSVYTRTTLDFVIDCNNLLEVSRQGFYTKSQQLKDLGIVVDDSMTINPNVLHALPLTTDSSPQDLFSSTRDDSQYWIDIDLLPEYFGNLEKWDEIIKTNQDAKKYMNSLNVLEGYIDLGCSLLPKLQLVIDSYGKNASEYNTQVLTAIRNIKEATLGEDVIPKLYSSDPEGALEAIKSDVNLVASQMSYWFSINNTFVTSLYKAMVAFASNATIANTVLTSVCRPDSYVAESTIDRSQITF